MADRVRPGLSASEGRRFGLVTGGAFLALAGVFVWKGHVYPSSVAGALGLLLALGGLLVPARLGPVHRAWMAIAVGLSRITTPILLAIVYFGVVTPIGLVRRAWRRLREGRPESPASLWLAREAVGLGTRSDLDRQF